MKCVLASAPEVRGDKIRESVLVEIERLVGKSRDEIKVAIIADASMSDDFSQHWLIEQLKSISDTFYKKVFFFSRDGYMMEKAFHFFNVKNDIQTQYVYFSRNGSQFESLIS